MTGPSELRAAEAEYRKGALNAEKPKAPWPLYAAAVLLFCVDRFLKARALQEVSYGWPGKAEFTLFLNEGIAFSIPVPDMAFWPAALIAITILLVAFARALRRDPWGSAILTIIILGAVSNLADRVQHDATVDYLLFFGRSAVNIADGMIVGGLLALAFRKPNRKD